MSSNKRISINSTLGESNIKLKDLPVYAEDLPSVPDDAFTSVPEEALQEVAADLDADYTRPGVSKLKKPKRKCQTEAGLAERKS